MNTILTYIFEVSVNFAEAGLFFYLISHKLDLKERYYERKRLIGTAWTLTFTAIITVANAIGANGTFGVLFFLMAQGVFTIWVMDGENAEKFLWAGIYITADLSADVLGFFASSIITSKNADALMLEYPYRYVVTTAYTILLTLYVAALCRVQKQKIILPKRSLYIFTIVMAVGVIIIQVMLGACIEYSYMLSTGQLYGLYAIMTLILILIALSVISFIGLGGTYEKNRILAQERKNEQREKEELENIIKKLTVPNEKYYYFKANGTAHKIDLKKVKRITSYLRMITIIMEDKKEYEFYGKLDEVFKEAENIYPKFKRVHKSAAVNMDYVEFVNAKKVIIDGEEIMISRKYRENFKEYN